MRTCKLFLLTIIVISTCAAQVQFSPTSMSFTVVAGGDPPPSQRIKVISITDAPFTLSVLGDGGAPGTEAPPWLLFRPRTLTTPGTVNVSVDPSGLAVGMQATVHLVLTSPAGIALADPIPISLQVVTGSSNLVVVPEALRVTMEASGSAPRFIEQTLLLRNEGPQGLDPVTLSLRGSAPWLSVAPVESCGRGCLVRVTVDRFNLPPGANRAVIEVSTAAGSREVPVSAFAARDRPILALQPSALQFEARQGHSLSETRDISIRNRGDLLVNWVASVESGGAWLSPFTTSGSATSDSPGILSVNVNASGLPIGAHYAVVRISSPQVLNSPQFLPVMLRVTDSGSPPAPILQPVGIVLTAATGTPPLPVEPVVVSTSSAAPIPYHASVQLVNGTGWLSVSPIRGPTSSGSPATARVSVVPTAVPSGIYQGRLNFVMGTGNLSIRSLNVTLIVHPGPSCVPSGLSVTHLTLVDNFQTQVGSYVPLVVRMLDSCGRAVTNGQVAVTFSNGDAPVLLQHLQDGVYSGAWSPQKAASSVSVTALGSGPSFMRAAKAEQVGSVSDSGNHGPILAPNGTLNNLNPLIGGPLAPGTIVQIFGLELATGVAQPPLIGGLLPDTFNGTTVYVGGRRVPLYFLSDGQLNGQIPVELTADSQAHILVELNGAYSLPDTINITAVQPGVAVFPDGKVIAQHADYSLVDEGNPARPGEFIIIYLVGMGLTSPAIGTGVPTPNSLVRVIQPPEVTIDGQVAEVAFAGLTPGSVGLYQINVRVPPNARSGNLKIVVTQDRAVANESSLVVR